MNKQKPVAYRVMGLFFNSVEECFHKLGKEACEKLEPLYLNKAQQNRLTNCAAWREQYRVGQERQSPAVAVPSNIGELIRNVERWGVECTGNEPSLSCFNRAIDELREALSTPTPPSAEQTITSGELFGANPVAICSLAPVAEITAAFADKGKFFNVNWFTTDFAIGDKLYREPKRVEQPYSVLETIEKLREHSNENARDPLDILDEIRRG